MCRRKYCAGEPAATLTPPTVNRHRLPSPLRIRYASGDFAVEDGIVVGEAAVFRPSLATGRSIPSPLSLTNVTSSPAFTSQAAEIAGERAPRTLRRATMSTTASVGIVSLISRWWRRSFSDENMCRFQKNQRRRLELVTDNDERIGQPTELCVQYVRWRRRRWRHCRK
ncbi:phenylalanine--tRNA ligase alpha subunit [Striga asiatica]|uniref:Phenylalanine--tRNA ligase alpha subunit n=1 Tax=Striga asiatica TaxID=4170 RepID=A0A5A7PT78_STRAF|nr:phenylalanine--tRNA ligase alpha subunit [Striga asiatica]